MSNKKENIKIKRFSKGLIKNSFNYKVFFTLVSSMKRAGQDIKSYLDDHAWFDPVALMKGPYYYSAVEDSAPTSKEMTEAVIKEAIRRLELSDYIKIIKDKQNKEGKTYKISLTKKGALEAVRCRVDQQKQKQKWDGKWRIIVFDILEDKRQIRDLLRNRLKWLGFKELQKSVWIFPYDVKKEMEQILEVCHIDVVGDVRFLTVEKMNDDEDLKRDFEIAT